MKRGRLGKKETSFIRENAAKLTIQQIADKLHHGVVTIHNWIIRKAPELMKISPSYTGNSSHLITQDGTPDNPAIIRYLGLNELRNRPEWKHLKDELTPDELEYFEYRYGQLIMQFKEDVLPTEETQIFFLIKIELLMRRNMRERKRCLQDVERMEEMLDKTLAQYKGNEIAMDSRTKEQIIDMERQLELSRSATHTKSKEYMDLNAKHSVIMKELKGTRDQRISKVENSKESFIGLIKDLQKEEIKMKEARYMELMRLASEKEFKRLSEPHKYVDGQIDQPILSAETVK